MVEFFTPGCAQCQKLAPDYSRVAKSLKGIATVAAVDCEAEKKLCSKQRIQGFPSLKLYSGELTKNPYTGKLQRTEQDYTGPRTAGSIAKAIKAALPTHLETISSAADWEAFKETLSQGTPLVVLATTSKSTTPLYKALALRFRGRLRFAEVHSDTAEGLDELKADSFPQLTVLLPDGAKEKYEGELQAALLTDFLEKHALPLSSASEGSSVGKADDASGASDALKALSAGDFGEKVLGEEAPVLVAFLAPENKGCAEEEKALGASLSDLDGMLPMYSLRVEEGSEAERIALQYSDDATSVADALKRRPCQPKLALFQFGVEKEDEDPEVYTGATDDKKAIQAFVYDALPSFVVRLTGSLLQQYVASDVEKPKVVLLTAKDDTPGMFKALALNFRNSFGFAEIHKSEKEAVAQFPGAKFPSMFVLMPPREDQEQIGILPVSVPLRFPVVKLFLEQVRSQDGPEEAEPEAGGAADSGNAQPGSLVGVTTDAEFREACVDSRRLCAIAFLDPGEEDDFEKRTGIMDKVMSKQSRSPINFVWIDGRKQPDFASALDVRSTDIPTIVVLSAQKLRYAPLRGAFVESAILSHLDGVLTGKIRTAPLQIVPHLTDVDENLREEELSLQEEEFDLSDIMSEEVAESAVTNEQRLRDYTDELENDASSKGKRGGKSKKKSKKSKKSKDEL
eukprot:CAMPEP_0177607256 /NCGR_PEP_ID=MMETSP0419_2-20121207/17813_1 /TAXON_ID=582737 /ORGANISM="Tetraselmis sp., Strain GSL018" /LENGTH=681 /DNA_ID=CAMNT_0019101811 /DNA_START=384 /DNA_END=2429 /DNA_ORIENTATION=-